MLQRFGCARARLHPTHMVLMALAVTYVGASEPDIYHDYTTSITLEVSGSGQTLPDLTPRARLFDTSTEIIFDFKDKGIIIDNLLISASKNRQGGIVSLRVVDDGGAHTVLFSDPDAGLQLHNLLQPAFALRDPVFMQRCATTVFNAHSSDSGQPLTLPVAVRAMLDAFYYAATTQNISADDLDEFAQRWQDVFSYIQVGIGALTP